MASALAPSVLVMLQTMSEKVSSNIPMKMSE